MATVTASAVARRIISDAEKLPKMSRPHPWPAPPLRDDIYRDLWRRLGRFEHMLPNLEAKTDFDGELWELAKHWVGEEL